MPQVKKIRAGDMQISAKGWNDIADAINGGVSAGPPAFGSLFSASVLVRNDTGSDRNQFDCLSLGEPLFELESDGSADLIFAGEVADADKPAAILTEPIAHNASDKRFGRALIYGLAYAWVGQATATTVTRATPDATNHRLDPSDDGNIVLLAAPSTTETKLLPVLLGAAGGGGDKHYLYTLTAAMTSGSGTATIRNLADDTEIETGATILGPRGLFDGLAIGRGGPCVKQGGAYYALGPYVTKVRWDDPDLEYSKDDGTNWTNIDTAEDCS
jgi:hypothetical protein